MAEALGNAGYKVEIFSGGVIGFQPLLRFDFDFRTDGWLADERLKSHLIFQKNKDWAQKLVHGKYCVIDIGNPYNQSLSVFYEMEKQVIFGDPEN